MPDRRISLRLALVCAALAPPLTAAACLGMAVGGLRAPPLLDARAGPVIGAGATAAAALGALACFALRRAVLSPLSELANGIAAMRRGGEVGSRLATVGERAFDRLVAEFNALLDVNEHELRASVAAVTEARDAAEAANISKSQFLANMSHEIRTPLNGVVGVVDALSRTRLDPRQREMVELVRASGEALERILSDVLDLSRMESGKLQIEARVFDLAGAVQAAADLMSLRAHEKGVGFALELAIDQPSWVIGDEVRIKQILCNLLSNAVKFTERGLVRLSVRPERDRYLFTVSDTGVGFDAAQRETIFRRFQQADNTITRRFGGTGLGLAISAELASLMGGELDCFSVPGRGSRFWLTLALPAAAAPATAPEAEPAATAAPADDDPPLRVLLADDHPVNRRVVELILQAADVRLVQVEDGAAAVEAFEPGGFDLVLMDMQMPVMDGLSATRAIRERERDAGASPVRLVMLTANAGREHVEASAQAGADAHMTKPITADALLGVVAEVAVARRLDLRTDEATSASGRA
jgi:signal transduction histidine kinase/AmiR/NasT family two-component response regulator